MCVCVCSCVWTRPRTTTGKSNRRIGVGIVGAGGSKRGGGDQQGDQTAPRTRRERAEFAAIARAILRGRAVRSTQPGTRGSRDPGLSAPSLPYACVWAGRKPSQRERGSETEISRPGVEPPLRIVPLFSPFPALTSGGLRAVEALETSGVVLALRRRQLGEPQVAERGQVVLDRRQVDKVAEAPRVAPHQAARGAPADPAEAILCRDRLLSPSTHPGSTPVKGARERGERGRKHTGQGVLGLPSKIAGTEVSRY